MREREIAFPPAMARRQLRREADAKHRGAPRSEGHSEFISASASTAILSPT